MILAVALATISSVEAQTNKMTTQKLYDKYNGLKNIVTMNIPGAMLAATGEMDEAVVDKINALTMIISDVMPKEFEKDVESLLKDGDYTSLMNINSEGERVGIYMSEKNSEFLLVVYSSSGECVFMSVCGEGLNMNDIMSINQGGINLPL